MRYHCMHAICYSEVLAVLSRVRRPGYPPSDKNKVVLKEVIMHGFVLSHVDGV